MPSIKYWTRPHVFLSFAWLKKNNQLAWTFSSVAGEWWCQSNKTQKISATINRFRTRLTVWILMQLILKSETKRKFRTCFGTNLKRKSMVNFFCAVENLERFFHKSYSISNFFSMHILATSFYENSFKLLMLFIIMILQSYFKEEVIIGRCSSKIAVL